MGYMDLTTIGSDLASNAVDNTINGIVKSLRKELKNKEEGHNTPGLWNVAMMFDEMLLPGHFAEHCNEKLLLLALEIDVKLDKLIEKTSAEKWRDGNNKQYHLRAFKKWSKSVKKFIEISNKNWFS